MKERFPLFHGKNIFVSHAEKTTVGLSVQEPEEQQRV